MRTKHIGWRVLRCGFKRPDVGSGGGALWWRRLFSMVLIAWVVAFGPSLSHVLAQSVPGAAPPASPPDANAEAGKQLKLGHGQAPLQIDADPLSATERASFGAQPKDAPARIGIGRDLPTQFRGNLFPQLLWVPVPGGGQAASLSITTPGALGIRLAIEAAQLPPGTEVRVASPENGERFGPYGPNELQPTAPSAGAVASQPEPFWSAVLEGDTGVVEIFVPTSTFQPFTFRISRIQHLAYSLQNPDKRLIDIGFSGWCEIDVKCKTTSPSRLGASVAKIVFSDAGSTYLCTGTLLNDSVAGTYVPYLMTANHCVSAQAVARTIDSYWFFERAYCGGPNPNSVTHFTGGADLLFTTTTTDQTLLRMRDSAISKLNGIYFAGWSVANPTNRTIVGLHHPEGDLKKWSQGVADGFAAYGSNTLGSGTHIKVRWSEGVTEPGSSGSGLFVYDTGAAQQLFVGTLHGGLSYCSAPSDPDWYGRFDLTYASVKGWLNPQQTPLSVTSLTPSVSTTIATTPVTWTASASGGATPYTYKFWVFNGSTWSVGRDWNASNTWNWTPAVAGTYTVQVWVRNSGSTANSDASRTSASFVVTPRPLSILAITPSPALVTAGSPVTWTAVAAGGTAPYTYQFFFYDGTRWTSSGWTSSASWSWTPEAPGGYTMQVWVRNAGSTANRDTYRSSSYFAARPAGLLATGLTADRTSPTPYLTPVTWTAKATGGTGPYTYRFFVWNGASWTVGQDWSSSRTFVWIPPAAGSYQFQVWIRNAGSGATYDAWRGAGPYTASSWVPLSVSNLSADRAFPVPAGTPVTWTATAIGGVGPYTYRFYVNNGSSWSIGRDWNSSNTWMWVPPSPGTYSFQVWARNAGSSSNYDASRSAGPASAGSPVPLSVTSFTTSPLLPLVTRATTRFTAVARGGSGPYTYQFWAWNGSAWTIIQAWSQSNTVDWTPTSPGTYSIQVWVRNAGSVAAYDAWQGLAGVTVLP